MKNITQHKTMANVVSIIGHTGSGKSTSIRTLDPEKTVIINPLGKDMPFKSWKSMYSQDKKNMFIVDKTEHLTTAIQTISETMPNVTTIIVDDAEYFMNIEMFEKAKVKGYDKFTEIAYNMFRTLKAAKSARKDLDVVFMFHMDEQIVDGLNIQRKIKLPGRMIEERFNPMELSTVAAFADVEFPKGEEEERYSFVVRKTVDYQTAKSPMGMFENKKIPNDLNLLLTTMREYAN